MVKREHRVLPSRPKIRPIRYALPAWAADTGCWFWFTMAHAFHAQAVKAATGLTVTSYSKAPYPANPGPPSDNDRTGLTL